MLFATAIVVATWLFLPRPPLLDGVAFSQCVRDRNGELLRTTLTSDQKFRIWTPLSRISPELVDATLQYEDKYFARHPGVNPIALVRSGFGMLRGGPRTGASTITMQVARLRFHLQTRTPVGKIKQIVRALELERHYSKPQILEAYLNLAPYGRNIEGIGAATQIYFGKSAMELSRPEAISLSVIPQSPTRRALHPDRDNRSLNAAQNNWYDRGNHDQSLAAREFSARAEAERTFFAPHFVQQVLSDDRSPRSVAASITTTLDLEKQKMIERRMADYIRANQNRGFRNAAAMLVDVRNMEVLAQVGSAGFFNADIQGQVDGTRSPRSPGSTLKPFVYALALDQGLIHPLSIVADAPRSFGDYNPENFDRDFLGPIRASDALARSRNLPAVELASQLANPTLYEFLRGAGVALPRSEPLYGLALPLGGAEIKMEDLVKLYAALGHNGELRPLRRRTTDPIPKRGTQILTPEAAFLTLEMLNVPRPEIGYVDSNNVSPVFWKTGTSHGFHDAWSIAVFNHYVVAVWIGNFDSKPNPGFIGRAAAAPLLFQIIDALRASWPEPVQPHRPPSNANLKRVEFCAVSGDLPGKHCSQRIEGWFIPGISPIKTCDIHQEVLVDAATGLRVSVDDRTRILRHEVYEFWPSDLLKLFERAGLPRRSPPPFLPGTESDLTARSGNAPKIISPAEGNATILDTSGEIPLRAKTDADVREIYWFADKSFIGKSRASDIMSWKSSRGSYQLIALDDHGRSTSCRVDVR
ncbi:MAG TPA: penicillin-binding protein 1C [Chthoniobacterales bacterium]|nr:penicillin-binding protein 1C [Chthoniobacterales bacterium]